MNRAVKVSVIMSEYDTDAKLFDRAICSILNQTFSDFELIIVDDSGKNQLENRLSKYRDDRIILLKNQINRGLVYSLNKAIEHAKGAYLVRMDTDDEALPERISKLYEYITNHPQFAVVSSRVVEVEDQTELGILGKAGEKKAPQIVKGDTPVHPACILEKKAVQEVGCYQNYQRAEDFVLWCELLLQGYRIYVMKDILLKYQVGSADYAKRKLRYRKDELKARLYYNKKLKAGVAGYSRIVKSILSGLLPVSLVQLYREKVILHKQHKGPK